MRKIKALVFDFDGLILDTELPNLCAWQEVYRLYGKELPFEKYALTVGTDERSFNPITHLIELIGESSTIKQKEIIVRQKILLEKYLSSSELMPGVRTYLEAAKSEGIKTSIASSSNDAWVSGHLHRLQCTDMFDSVVTAGSIYPPKPNPTVYKTALSNLCVEPDEAIAFEDSVNGVSAARLAGIFCVAVPNSVTVNMDFFESDLQIPSLLTISLAELVKIVESS